jgi:alpha-tubulin suppressor-like RCC1 family protein
VIPAPPAGEFVAVGAGITMACGIRKSGKPACWDTDLVPPIGTFVSLAVGTSHACAIGTDGVMKCWGTNEKGQSDPPNVVFRH